mgnify:CR=1 FL=1
MAKFNFPTSPSTNQDYTANNVTWRWNGHAWKRRTGVGAPTGPQGAQGVQGSQGHQGRQGAQGVQGTSGQVGTLGAQGHQGVQGAQGAVGASGGAGAQGHQGHQGRQGSSGPTRLNGFGHISGLNASQGNSSGSMNRAYNVSSHSGNFQNDDANDHYDGGMTINWSSAIGASNYTVLISDNMMFGGLYSYWNYSGDMAFTRTNNPMHAYDIVSGSFKMRGWGHYSTDNGTFWTFPSNIHFAAFDT